ncbi:RadC family protein [Acuticoccus yangtzensis]|uniref:RadC family protein n=1 Tax=Acuticoccus yangtzensis TaxID=1443441 RepID=UPI000ABC314E|nr:DNA repair protein RadC [Acuticoccus yangtzensis]
MPQTRSEPRVQGEIGPGEWGGEVSDQRLLELLLRGTAAPSQVPHLARRLLAKFGDIGRLLGASPEALARAGGLGGEAVHQLKLAEAVALRLGRRRMQEEIRLGRFDAVVDYLRLRLGHAHVEALWALYLNVKHGLIADEEHAHGTIDHTPAYPREIVRRALEVGAAGVVLVHNHPSGDPTPSQRDIALTHKVHAALATVDIRLHDHIIITLRGEASLAAMGHVAGR